MSSEAAAAPQVVLVTAGYDHSIRFWAASSGTCYAQKRFSDSHVNALAVSGDKCKVAAVGNPMVRLYDVQSNSSAPYFEGKEHKGNVSAVGFQMDLVWMFTASEDGTAKVWDMRTAPSARMTLEVGSPVTSAVVHPNQGELVIGDAAGRMRVWDMSANKCVSTWTASAGSEDPLQSVTVSRTGRHFAAVSQKGEASVWSPSQENAAEVSLVARRTVVDGYGLKCVASPDASTLAVCGSDHTVRLCQMSDLAERSKLEAHSRWVWDCVFSADSSYLVTASSDQTAKLWDLYQGKAIKQYSGHEKAVTAVALNDSSG